ncbi:MAG: hypothetical protein JWP34_5262 [Massilia sp.]|nr:hypothetical protein [Massilia sp.]
MLFGLIRIGRDARVDARRPSGAQRHGRAVTFHVETLEGRTLLSAVVTTDQADYAPGSTAIFTATTDGGPTSNFLPGETIQFHVDRTDGVSVSSPPAVTDWQVTDGVGGFAPYQDPSGMWVYPDNDGLVDGSAQTTWSVDPQFAGASLSITATGLASGESATAFFTDTAHIQSVTVTPTTGTTTVNVGTTFSITSAWNGNGTDTAALSIVNGSAGWNNAWASFSPSTLSLGSPASTLTITPTATGTYTFNVRATESSTVDSSQITLIVNKASTTTVTRTAGVTPSTYGTSLTFHAAVSGSGGTPSGTVQFQVDGINFGSPIALSGGAADLITTTIGVGNSRQVTAVYSGDSTFGASTSTAVAQTITAKTLTASIIGTPTKTYNGTTSATLTSANFSLSGLVGSDTFTVTQTAGTYNSKDVASANSVTASLTAGNFTPGGGAQASNYTLPTSATGAGTITAKALTVTTPAVTSKPYDGTNAATITGTLSGVVGGDSVSLVGTGTFNTANVGANKAVTSTSTLSGAQAGNYSLTQPTGLTGTITARALTVTASNQSKTYGTALALGSTAFISSGLQNGETIGGVTLSSSGAAASATVSGSPYAITASAATGGTFTTSNYSITYTNGTLTVTKAHLTVTADNQSRAYGAANPTLTATITGFVNGQTLGTSGVTGAAALNTAATPGSPVAGDPYSITVTAGTLSAANYDFPNLINGNLTVTKAHLTVTADNQSKVYGAPLPSLTATISGFVNGENLGTSGVTGSAGVSTTATAGSSVAGSPYAITAAVGSLSASNYDFTTFNPGALTVTRAGLTVTALNATKVYGSPNPGFTDTVTGFVNGDTAAVVSGSASLTTTATASSGVGTYTITAAHGSLSAANYTFSFVNGVLSVTPATLTVTATNATKVYGAPNPAFADTITGFVNGDTSSVVSGSASLTTAATTSSGVGNYTITAAQGTLAATNYTFGFVNGTLAVTPAGLTVTANNATKVYGTGNPAFSASYGGFVNGDTSSSLGGTLAFSTSATNASPVGSYAVAPSGLTSSNYTITFINGNLTVTKAHLTVTADNQSKVYGAPLPTLTATISGFVNGETLGTSGVSGSAIVSTTATAGSSVAGSPYTITAAIGSLSASNYDFTTFNPGIVAVTPAALTVSADNATKVYGSPNPPFTANYSGFVNGDSSSSLGGTLAFSTAANNASPVGGYPVTPSGLTSSNYTITFTDGSLSVTPAALSVTANNASKTYGDVNPAFSGTLIGVVAGDNITASYFTTATQFTGVGTAPITATLSDPGSRLSNYTITNTPGTLTIDKAHLTVTADNQSKSYGATLPTLTATISGFVNGENLGTSGVAGSAAVTTTATASSAVGSYLITAAPGTLSAANYDFTTFNPGTLSVTTVALSVTADNATKIYGDSNPTFTASYSGFVNGDTSSSLGGTLAFSTSATNASPVGNYAVTPSGLTSSNYTITFTDGTLAVTKAHLTVTANDATKIYGQANPALSATITGFVNGDNAAVISGAASLGTAATAGSGVGSYAITAAIGTLSAANYDFTIFNPGTLAVTPASLTVTANNATKVYGQANPAFSASYGGFVNGDTSSSLGGALAFSTPATASSLVGSYTVTPSGLTSGNYTITYISGTLTVTPADVSASVSVTRGGYRRSLSNGQYYYFQTVTITNTSGSTLSGPLSLSLGGLTSGVSLFNASGATADGNPYIIVTTGSLAPGQSVSVVLQFSNPFNVAINYSTRLLAGIAGH